jgi:hypothetical protein
MKKTFEEPDVETYERDELVVEKVFTGDPQS